MPMQGVTHQQQEHFSQQQQSQWQPQQQWSQCGSPPYVQPAFSTVHVTPPPPPQPMRHASVWPDGTHNWQDGSHAHQAASSEGWSSWHSAPPAQHFTPPLLPSGGYPSTLTFASPSMQSEASAIVAMMQQFSLREEQRSQEQARREQREAERDRMRTEKLENFSKTDHSALITELAPLELISYMPVFEQRAKQHLPECAALFSMTIDEYTVAVASTPRLAMVNAWLARNLHNCFDPKSEYVKAFTKSVLTANPALLSNGVALWAEVKALTTLKPGVREDKAASDYKATAFFRTPMLPHQIESGMSDLEIAFTRLPDYRNERDLIYAIIAKLPDSLKKEREELRMKMKKKEAVGKPLYSKQQLTDLFSVMLAGSDATTNSFEEPPPPKDIAKKKRCTNCGKEGHKWGDKICKAKPKAPCTRRFCPCARGDPCVTITDKDVPAKVPDAIGGFIPDGLRDKLVDDNAKHRKIGAYAGSIEVPPCEDVCTDCDDADSLGDDFYTLYTGSIEAPPTYDQGTDALTVAGSTEQTSSASDTGSESFDEAPPCFADFEGYCCDCGQREAFCDCTTCNECDQSDSPWRNECTCTPSKLFALSIVAAHLTEGASDEHGNQDALLWGKVGLNLAQQLPMVASHRLQLEEQPQYIAAIEESRKVEPANELPHQTLSLTPTLTPTSECHELGAGRQAVALGALSMPQANVTAVESTGEMFVASGEQQSQLCTDGIELATPSRRPSGRSLVITLMLAAMACLPIALGGAQSLLHGAAKRVSSLAHACMGAVWWTIFFISAVTVSRATHRHGYTAECASGEAGDSQVVSSTLPPGGNGSIMFLGGACFSTNMRRSVLAESWLDDHYGVEALKKQGIMRWPDGATVPLVRDNGLYFVDVYVVRPGKPDLPLRMQVDGGSNVCTVNESAARSYGKIFNESIGVRGIGAAADVIVNEKIDIYIRFGEPITYDAATAECSTAALSADEPSLLWACRMHADAPGVLKLAQSAHGVPIQKISTRAAEAIDRDEFRRISLSKRNPVGATPVNQRAACSGEGFICDGFGVHSAKSPIDGSVYAAHAVCDFSDFGYGEEMRNHTVDNWLTFLHRVVNHARSCGHEPKWIRFDRDPALDCELLKRRVETELHLHVTFAPRRRHEAVGRAEALNDALTRTAEADLQRCGRGTAMLLPARKYALWRRNRKCCGTAKHTRYQIYTRRIPDLSTLVPYLFGTSGLAHETKEGRGPKGSLDKPRAIRGTLVGIDGSSYVVLKQSGGTIHAEQFDPLDEMQLVRRGIPAGAAGVEVEVQTDVSDLPPPPAPKQKPPPREPLDLPVGARVAIMWTSHDGKSRDEWAGSVIAIEQLGKGKRLWEVEYDDGNENSKIDFESTTRVWVRLPENRPPPPHAPPPASSSRATRSQTRAATRRLAAAVSAIEASLEASPESEAVAAFHAAVYQHLGEPGLQFTAECTSTEDMNLRRVELVTLANGLADGVVDRNRIAALAECASAVANAQPPSAPQLIDMEASIAAEQRARTQQDEVRGRARNDETPVFPQRSKATERRLAQAAIGFVRAQVERAECAKATQTTVDVTTKLGKAQYKVPSSKRELEQSMQREQWTESDRKALNVIIANGNKLVPTSKPRSLGLPIARCVTARKIKVDANGELEKHNAFKSRHAYDSTQMTGTQLSKLADPTEPEVPSTATIADELLIKMCLADVAVRNRNLVKGDVGNAYALAGRQRAPTYMALPSTLPMFDEDGTPLCIELHTPMWGEGPAGYEWQCTFNQALMDMGWKQSETVPALFTFDGANGNDARLLTIVDDFLISEAKGTAIADATIAALRERFGEVKAEHEPTSFAGYRIARDREAGTLTISMPQKAVEAAREHAPTLIDGGKLDVPTGAKLMAMADKLEMPEHTPGARLDATQTSTQRIIGACKFMEKVNPRLCLPLHRLSCVMSFPPPDAHTVALATLALAYKHRDVGITYGGPGGDDSARLSGVLNSNLLDEPAPAALESSADATWGDRLLYGLQLTYGRGAVAHMTKKIGLILDSSMEAEGVASSKAGEVDTYAREILRALGVPAQQPTIIMTDNKANLQVANNSSAATRSRHFLRRYWALQQRISRGDVKLVKADDAWMPADYLTKWVGRAKVNQSVAYATNSRNAVRAAAVR